MLKFLKLKKPSECLHYRFPGVPVSRLSLIASQHHARPLIGHAGEYDHGHKRGSLVRWHCVCARGRSGRLWAQTWSGRSAR